MKYILDRVILMVIIAGMLFAGLWAFKSYLETKKAIAYKQLEHQDKEYLKEFVKLKDEIVKLKSESVSERKIKKIIKEEMGKVVVDAIKKHKEKPQLITVSTVNTKQEVELDPKIWKHYENKDNPHAEYYFMKLYKTDSSGTKIPWAWVMYFPNRDKKWKYGFYPLKLRSKTVVTKQETGGLNTYTQLTVENEKDKDSAGKIQKLTISPKDSYVKFVYPPKRERFHWWNPNLSIGYGVYYNIDDDNFVNGLEFGFNFLNYGVKERVNYKFLTFGIGSNFGDDNWGFVSPVEINLQKFRIPLIHHIHLIPVKAGYTDGSDWLIGSGLNIEF